MIVSPLAPVAPPLPASRGPLSEFLIDRWQGPARPLSGAPAVGGRDPLSDDDLHLALYLCYELHYRSFAGIDDGWEWEPTLLAYRRQLERPFESALRDLGDPADRAVPPDEAAATVLRIVTTGGGPSLSMWFEERGTKREFAEFAVHRSAYQLKEADPHTWVIPRLAGRPKAACVDIQSGEYGDGREPDMHANLFAAVLEALGLDSSYGAYIDRLPGVTLATVNLISFFGLHRRWRGALVGHLAGFEMTSVVPMGRYAAAVDRLGLPPSARRFYAAHVTADAHHEVVAADGLVGGLASREPELVPDILLGARALVAVEGRFTGHLLSAWAAGRSSLRPSRMGR